MEVPKRRNQTQQIGQQSLAYMLEADDLAQYVHVKAAACDVQKALAVDRRHIQLDFLAVQLSNERFERVRREIEHADKVVARSAGYEIERHRALGKPGSDFAQRSVAADSDNRFTAGQRGLAGKTGGMFFGFGHFHPVGDGAGFQQLADALQYDFSPSSARRRIGDHSKHSYHIQLCIILAYTQLYIGIVT